MPCPNPALFPAPYSRKNGPPLQTTAAARPEQAVQKHEGAGEPDTNCGCSPARQDPTPFPGGVLGDAPSHRPRPIGRQRAAKPKAKSATASPAPTSRRRLLLPALPKPSAAHTLLPKKAGALLEKRTPASGKCLVRRETEAVPSTGVRHGSKAAVTDPALAGGRVPRRDRAGTAERDSFHRRSRGHRDPVGHAERLLLTLLHILIRMTKIR